MNLLLLLKGKKRLGLRFNLLKAIEVKFRPGRALRLRILGRRPRTNSDTNRRKSMPTQLHLSLALPVVKPHRICGRL